jgi:hypothetical protein
LVGATNLLVDLHDRMIGALFNRAKRAHAEQFQQSARAINEKLRLYWRIGEALPEAKRNGSDLFHASFHGTLSRKA